MAKSDRGHKKSRYGAPLGAILQKLFDTPPYTDNPHLGGLKIWTPLRFSHAVGVSDAAVRQWLRGDELPTNSMVPIVRELFGPKPDGFKKQIDELWNVFRDCQRLKKEARASSKNGKTESAENPLQTEDNNLETLFATARQAVTLPEIQEPPTHFLGRDDDIRRIREALLTSESPVAILVHGVAGIGKTTLTRAVAHDPAVTGRFGDRRWFAALETAKTSDQMKDMIVLALGGDRAEGLTKTLDRIAGLPGLLILDNLETPWELKDERRKTEAVLAMLANVPELALLASFRGTERISRPAWTLVYALDQLAPEPSKELFCRISRWQDRDDPIFREFVVDLDGLPLALELVAHRAFQAPSLRPIWERWKEIGAKFAAYPDLDPDHVTSLAASIELSLESPRMSVAALRMFSFLGRCPAGLACADQRALLGDLAYDASDTLRRVGLAIGDANRVDLLSPIRRYAITECRPSTDDENAWVEHFLELVRIQGGTIG